VDDPWLEASLWSSQFANPANGVVPPLYQALSISFADLDADQQDDLCGYTGNEVRCWGSKGVGFHAVGQSPWTTASSTFNNSWAGNEYYWKTIQYPDLDADGHADVCGRGYAGIYCAKTQMNGATPSFAAATLWTPQFGNPDNWHISPSYWQTI